ncbi:SDR family NAD(P)-dependent oxidoreductase, partial [Amycolatopsis mediterranei]|uniref:SDR family NAD(P)-dependent oxidoreductase n=1 Tax=Amycolatopsis mediterranei TaxID=33910 RepID=UPI0034412F57
GALSLEDAARVVALRSQAIAESLAGRGGMLSMSVSAETATERLRDLTGRVELAAVNGPASVVVAGDVDALAELLVTCENDGVRARMIPVDYASHTRHVEALHDRLRETLAGIRPTATGIPMWSTVTQEWLEGPELDAEYWYRNLRHRVGFGPAVEALVGQGHRVFVEVSPHPVLTTAVQEVLDGHDVAAVVTGTLRRDDGGLRRLLTSVAEVHVRGIPVTWTTGRPENHVDLPTYAFQRDRYWLEELEDPADEPGRTAHGFDGELWTAMEREDFAALDTLLRPESPEQQSSLRTVAPVLSSWYRQRRLESTVDDWCHRVGWKPLADPEPRELTGTWILVVPEDALDDQAVAAVADGLTAQGAWVTRLTLDPADAERAAVADRIREIVTEIGDVRDVVSFLGLARGADAASPVLPAAVATTVTLVQALGDAGVAAPLWAFTRGAVATGDDEPPGDPAQAMLWGLGRVAALEHPDRWAGLVDLPAVVDESALRYVLGVLAGAGDEDQLAVRAAGLLGRRLLPAPLTDVPPARPWQPHGTVLVTGGVSGVGAQVARWLAGAGAEHLVLAARRGARTPGAAELSAELEARGARVTIAECDVADRESLRRLLDGVSAELTAVVHAAAVATTGAIGDTTLPEFAEVLAGKAAGAANLDELLAGRPLEAFVLFSSIAAVWGSGGQGAYAAANAYLDALAAQRRARGLAATAIAWGAWGGGGMSSDSPDVEDQLRRTGLRTMAVEPALLALVRAVERAGSDLVVTDVDWERFAPGFTARRPSPLLGELAQVRRTLREDDTRTGDGEGEVQAEVLRQLAGLSEQDRMRALTDLVRTEAVGVLGLSSVDGIGSGQAFRDVGFDSLTAVDLRNRLTAATGLRLPAALVFDHPTPAAVAEFLGGRLAVPGEGAAPSILAELERLETAYRAPDADRAVRTQVVARMRALTAVWENADPGGDADLDFDLASDDQIFELIDTEFGTA